MFHNFCVSLGHQVLLERFYDSGTDKDGFLKELFAVTEKDWDIASTAQRIAIVGSVTVVFVQIGDLLFFLGGLGEYDELIVAEMLQCISEVVCSLCEKSVTEADFLAQYDKISLVLDHMIRHGIAEHCTKDTALAWLMQLQPEKATVQGLQQPELERVSVPNASIPPLSAGFKKKAAIKGERPRVDSTVIVPKKK